MRELRASREALEGTARDLKGKALPTGAPTEKKIESVDDKPGGPDRA